MKHRLTCPGYEYTFLVAGDYETGDCPNCGAWTYAWDRQDGEDAEGHPDHYGFYTWEQLPVETNDG